MRAALYNSRLQRTLGRYTSQRSIGFLVANPMDEQSWVRVLLRLGMLALLLLAIGRLRRGALREAGRDLLTLCSVPTWAVGVGTIFVLFLTFGLAVAAADEGATAWILLGILAIVDSIFLHAMVGRLRGAGDHASDK